MTALFPHPSIRAAVLPLWICGIVPGFTADPKPDVAIATKAVDPTVFPDAAIKADAELAFHCPPYAVGPSAAFMPWPELKPHLTREGSAVFGGERPRDDDKAPL